MTLLYDPDCGFCTTAARWLRGRDLTAEVRPLTHAAAQRGVDLPRAAREIPWVGPDGTVSYGARAIGLALATSTHPSWRTIGRALASRPGELLATPGYRWVAANRHRLPGGQPSCRLDG